MFVNKNISKLIKCHKFFLLYLKKFFKHLFVTLRYLIFLNLYLLVRSSIISRYSYCFSHFKMHQVFLGSSNFFFGDYEQLIDVLELDHEELQALLIPNFWMGVFWGDWMSACGENALLSELCRPLISDCCLCSCYRAIFPGFGRNIVWVGWKRLYGSQNVKSSTPLSTSKSNLRPTVCRISWM